ncbi:MAG TPA: hypothetical protein VGL86_21105 [Polyangia bacterium]
MRFAPTAVSIAVIGAVTGAMGLAAGGCLGSMPSSAASGTGGNAAPASGGDDAGVAAPDLASGPDLAPAPMPDLASTDLAGLVDCYGKAVCDPTMEFCIRLYPGSATTPGTPQPPACYQPVDCMGANMNCDCITQDATLSAYCANCVDHMDGTYDCYAQQ